MECLLGQPGSHAMQSCIKIIFRERITQTVPTMNHRPNLLEDTVNQVTAQCFRWQQGMWNQSSGVQAMPDKRPKGIARMGLQEAHAARDTVTLMNWRTGLVIQRLERNRLMLRRRWQPPGGILRCVQCDQGRWPQLPFSIHSCPACPDFGRSLHQIVVKLDGPFALTLGRRTGSICTPECRYRQKRIGLGRSRQDFVRQAQHPDPIPFAALGFEQTKDIQPAMRVALRLK